MNLHHPMKDGLEEAILIGQIVLIGRYDLTDLTALILLKEGVIAIQVKDQGVQIGIREMTEVTMTREIAATAEIVPTAEIAAIVAIVPIMATATETDLHAAGMTEVPEMTEAIRAIVHTAVTGVNEAIAQPIPTGVTAPTVPTEVTEATVLTAAIHLAEVISHVKTIVPVVPSKNPEALKTVLHKEADSVLLIIEEAEAAEWSIQVTSDPNTLQHWKQCLKDQ